MTHTPGPWTASGPSELGGRYSVYHNGPLLYCDKAEDARLIAAAPDLLDALRDFSAAFHKGDGDCTPSQLRAKKAARAAIARATG